MHTSTDHNTRRARFAGIAAFTLALSTVTASPLANQVNALDTRSIASSSSSTSAWTRHALAPRHGDHGHDDEEDEEKTPAHADEHTHMHDDHHEAMAQPSIPLANFSREHGPFTAAVDLPDPSSPDASSLTALLLPIPPPPPGNWGGHHHHGDAPAKTHFNETDLFYSKGPAPLSYIEWDMRWGPARTNQLRRFVAAEETGGEQLMGAVDGRWRKLFDEPDPARRTALNEELKAFVESEEPARHFWLMVTHIVGCMLACFILLPVTLFLRAANSSLAPLAACSYLITLLLSLLLGGIYKALTPSLFAPNSHGKMGWALFWVSSIIFSVDALHLLRQLASVFGSHANGSSRWRGLWNRLQGTRSATSTDNGIALGEYAYSPEEEEIMLNTGTRSEADALEIVTVAKNIDQEHDDDASYRHHNEHEHGQYQAPPPRAVRRNGSSSSSQGSGSSLHADCPSPTGTLVGNHLFSTSPQDEIDAAKRLGLGRVRSQHHRRLSSISTLWERSSSTEEERKNPEDIITPAASEHALTRRQSFLRNLLRYGTVTVARALPILAFATTYTGLTVYTGSCRSNTVNGCAAHGIKGGIFFWFGLLTFGRYMGAYAEHGWAWNARPPSSSSSSSRGKGGQRRVIPSAEFVESFVIFLYGATNTWMERFGAKAGDPYSVKEVQHISIAVMYWFAGLVGIIIETEWTKRLLGLPIALTHRGARLVDRSTLGAQGGSGLRRSSSAPDGWAEGDEDDYAEALIDRQRLPPSYSGSFNPFPALCIGVTGIAMAAHHQDYVYEVEIHALWGNLLAGFAVLRCLTYFFLYLRPPTASILPGRPPTEALASFSLACGGLVFMLSSEEVSFLAMRSGWGDIMMVMNVSVASVCLVFAGIAGLFILKAWAVRRELRRTTRRGRLVANALRGRVGHVQRRVPLDEVSAPIFVVGEDGDEEHDGEVRMNAENDARAFTASPEMMPAPIRADDAATASTADTPSRV
ncbi:hypothetical protein V8E36_006476 [Tilletia maclaganii]